MELFEIENLTFAYPDSDPALKKINLSIKEGQMLLLLGASGSGKTTLLKQLKPQLTPYGNRKGEIYYDGQPFADLAPKRTVKEIGYVFQNPKHQIVTDKVWHEMTFGLENLQMSQADMELKIGEVASYFGIQNWFHKKTEELSGGQQQILNLAAILAMDPKVILLDEPTSQLDPIAARNFLEMVYRIKDEMGITIIVSEHRKDEIYRMADQVAVMEKGELLYVGTPRQTAAYLSDKQSFLLPVVQKLSKQLGMGKDVKKTKDESFKQNLIESLPISISEGRQWLKGYMKDHEIKPERKENSSEREITDSDKSVVLKEIYYRYERNTPDILRHFDVKIYQGESFGILGGNGAGKTTLLKIMAGMIKPYAGKRKVYQKAGYLSQDPQNMFVKERVDLEIENEAKKWISLFQMEELLNKHPYDLSGGEQQRLALLKLLDRNPELLLLDEPTKGMDEEGKKILGQILRQLQKEGHTIVMVTHDIEFAARYTDRCGLLFDGRLTGVHKTKEFFLQNQYYTTIARRMTRGFIPEIVLEEEAGQ